MKSDGWRNSEHLLAEKRDQLLVKETLAGESRSFARLMEQYKKRLTALGMSFFKNTTDTDDFVQEVFIKVYRNLSKFKGDSAFSTWLTRVAYNTAVNAVNRRKEYAPLADEEGIVDSNLTPEEKEIRRLTMEAVHEAVAELPEKYAVCLELYFFYDIPYDEISVITAYPVNTIKSHIFRAKSILREKLRGFYER